MVLVLEFNKLLINDIIWFMHETNKISELVKRLPPEEGDWAIEKMLVHWGLPLSALTQLAAVEERGGRARINASISNAAVPALGS